MSELSLFDKIQQGASNVDARDFLRNEEDQALARKEADELSQLAVLTGKKKKELQTELSTQEDAALVKADKDRRMMESSHLEEIKLLEANHKKDIDSLESKKQSNLKQIYQIGQKKHEAIDRVHMKMKTLQQDKFILKREDLAQKRQAEDEKTKLELYQIFRGESGACFSFSLPKPTEVVNNLSLVRITPSTAPETRLAQAGSAPSTGRHDVQLDTESPISPVWPNKRRKKSPEDLCDTQLLNPPREKYPKTTIRVEIPYIKPLPEALIISPQNEPPEQSNFSFQAANMICGQQSMSTARNHQVRLEVRFKMPSNWLGVKEPPNELILLAEQAPAPPKSYPIKYMSTNVSIFHKPTYQTPSDEPKFWLYYHATISSFNPDNGKPCASLYPEFVIWLKTIDIIEYNAEQNLVKVHRSAGRPFHKLKDSKMSVEGHKRYFSPLYIQFWGKDVTVAFVNYCKDKFPHVILMKLSDHVMEDKFRLQIRS